MGDESVNIVEVELSTRCTIGCALCPRQRERATKHLWDVGFMDIDVVKRIVSDKSVDKVIFCGCYGDAIYHPKFFEICKFTLQQGKPFIIETNGAHRTEEWWDKMCKLPWRPDTSWSFSIDGLEDTNHLYRKNSDWTSIVRGINKLRAAKFRPGLAWKFIIFPYNKHQIAAAKALSKEWGFDEFKAVKSLRYTECLSEEDRMLYDLEYHDAHSTKMS